MSKTQETTFERAKLAKACVAGGMAPYQAARKHGFMRVAIMEEAIRAMEKREAEEADGVKAESAETRQAPLSAPSGQLPQAGGSDLAEQERGRKIYPFLKPGEGEPRKPDTSMLVRNKFFAVKQNAGDGDKPERVRIYENGRPAPYLDIDRDKLGDLIQALTLYGEIDA